MAEKILILSPVPLFPAHAGNRRRMLRICQELMEEGYELDFFYSGYNEHLDEQHEQFFNGRVLEWREAPQTWGNVLRELPIRLGEITAGWRTSWDRFHRRLMDGKHSARWNRSLSEYAGLRKRIMLREQLPGRAYHAVIVNYAVQSAYFDLFPPSTRRILDTHDRLTDRYRFYLEQGVEPVRWHSLRWQDEKRALDRADVIWAITGQERSYFASMVHGKKVLRLAHLTPFRPIPALDIRAPETVLMIGSGNRINVNGLVWFLDHVWPQVKRRVSRARLLLAGSICDVGEVQDLLMEGRKEGAGEYPSGVELYGRYETDEEIYGLAGICVNPMRFGTGLKIKTLEALSHGKTVLTTREGASGLEELEGKGMICSDCPDDWIHSLSTLLENPDKTTHASGEAGEALDGMYEMNRAVLLESLRQPL